MLLDTKQRTIGELAQSQQEFALFSDAVLAYLHRFISGAGVHPDAVATMAEDFWADLSSDPRYACNVTPRHIECFLEMARRCQIDDPDVKRIFFADGKITVPLLNRAFYCWWCCVNKARDIEVARRDREKAAEEYRNMKPVDTSRISAMVAEWAERNGVGSYHSTTPRR